MPRKLLPRRRPRAAREPYVRASLRLRPPIGLRRADEPSPSLARSLARACLSRGGTAASSASTCATASPAHGGAGRIRLRAVSRPPVRRWSSRALRDPAALARRQSLLSVGIDRIGGRAWPRQDWRIERPTLVGSRMATLLAPLQPNSRHVWDVLIRIEDFHGGGSDELKLEAVRPDGSITRQLDKKSVSDHRACRHGVLYRRRCSTCARDGDSGHLVTHVLCTRSATISVVDRTWPASRSRNRRNTT